MKDNYLNQLKEILKAHRVHENDIDEVISDYSSLYDDALAKGFSDEQVYSYLGNPEQVFSELLDTLTIKQQKRQSRHHKIIALMPFLSVICFMLLGLIGDYWHPGWLVFLSIPVVSIILSTKGYSRIIALAPFISLISFLILGEFGYWNPGWLVFFIVPIIGITSLKPVIVAVIYELTFIFAIAFYLILGYQYGLWYYGALGFLLPLTLAIGLGDVTFHRFNKGENLKSKIIISLVFAISLLVFITTGILYSTWGYMWQIFLLIPITAVLLQKHFKWVTLTPFIAVIIFYSLGYFLDLWNFSWMAFLLIPIIGVLENS